MLAHFPLVQIRFQPDAFEMKLTWLALLAAVAVAGCDAPLTAPELAPSAASLSTAVPGHSRKADLDGNGFPDEGVIVTGKYNSVYKYDASGAYYWDLGDGRIVGDESALDETTLTTCIYPIQYRGTFENDAFQDTGWIGNRINCTGVDKGSYNYLMVHESDPRYTGNPDWALWGTWEYHLLTISGQGNLVRPYKAM